MKKIIIILILLAIPLSVSAKAGLGLSAPRFNLGELKKGQCYDIGTMVIFNYQGTSQGTYEMDVTYLHLQPERRIPRDWIIYTPTLFTLEPNLYQLVDVDLCIPNRARRGDYFAYLEAHLLSDSYISIAVATKLNFTIVNGRK